jgi:DNA replication ATP-dependent helicase Dna2
VEAERQTAEELAAGVVKAPPQLQHAQTFPSTPGTKLSLEDLIGNFDENPTRAAPADVSPEEHVGWIPNSSSNLLTPNRRRKRARSSSPSCPNTSSQRQEASMFFAGAGTQADNTTPDADPAADLWKRFAAEKQADGTSLLLTLGPMAFQGSPRTLETPAKNSVFRRWASTGNDWPSSKNKRRKVNGKSSIGIWQADQPADCSVKSRVAAMVDKLQETLASQDLDSAQTKPVVRVEGPSSSSPLPETGAAESFSINLAESPLQGKQVPFPVEVTVPQINNEAPQALKPLGRPSQGYQTDHTHAQQDQTLESMMSAPLHLQSKAPLPAYKRPSIARVPSVNLQQRVVAPTAAPIISNSDLDEFGDDLELTAEDLDELMIQPPPLHQRPLHQIPPHPDPPAPREISFEELRPEANVQHGNGTAYKPIQINDFDDDDDDEFACGDIDEAALVQVEISATQAYRASLSDSHS